MGMYDHEPSDAPASLMDGRPQLPYLLPMLAFGLVMSIKALGTVGGIDLKSLMHTYYPLEYGVKSMLAAALLIYFRKYYTPIRWSHLYLGFAFGILGVFQWIGTEYGMQAILSQIHVGNPPHPFFTPLTDADMTYIPTKEIPDFTLRILYYIERISLPVLVVPVMEELFWRDFMMRAMVRGARFQEVAIGTFTWLSLIATSVCFSLIHFQHTAAFVWSLMIGLLLIRTKSIGACIVAHATTNLFLYLYVLYTGDWQFW